MRPVQIVVGALPVGMAWTWAYPGGQKYQDHYRIPSYPVRVSGTDAQGQPSAYVFEALRFGVKEDGRGPRVVGLADQQTHVIKRWIPTYRVRSSPSVEGGAWHVYGNFLIHDGPDDPMGAWPPFATVGCVEICGRRGFEAFNDYIITLAEPTARARPQQLLEVGSSGLLSITYMAAKRPNVNLVPRNARDSSM